MKFILKRTVKYYEHCEVEAENVQAAYGLYFDNPDDADFDWQDSQLGEDTNLDAIENTETGEEHDIDDNGYLIEDMEGSNHD